MPNCALSARQRCRRGETACRRDVRNAPARIDNEAARRALDAHALDEFEHVFVRDRLEDAVKVKRRKGGDRREALERQILGQVRFDEVDDAVDALLVLGAAAITRRRARARDSRATAFRSAG